MDVKAIRTAGNGNTTYVVEGATLRCTFGSSPSILQIPTDRGIYRRGKREANVADHVGGVNIMSHGSCRRSLPPPACIMGTTSKWVRGKDDVHVDGEHALLNTSINFCSCGGVVHIVHDGQ